ncbi:MAG TPA: mechanosensitive ion channel family protein [Edaphocola sp.]|nr:mechanosensitive ion channel family protein [Edaphocola sp.]
MNMFPFTLLQSVLPTTMSSITQQGTQWTNKLIDLIYFFGPKIIGAILLYVIGSWIIKRIVNLIRKGINSKNMDPSFRKFLISLVNGSLLVLLFLSVAGVVGVPIMGFSAIIAGLAVGIGAALNGSLGNLAGGIMMMIFKPFKVGDIIEAQDKVGVVQELGIFNTIILTPDSKTVILPNGALSTGVIVNFNTHGNLRVDIDMAISNDQDIDLARKVALEAINKHPKVLITPAASVAVNSISDFMTKITIRPYTVQDDYWDVYFGVTELVRKAFDEQGIQGPTPTRVIINK